MPKGLFAAFCKQSHLAESLPNVEPIIPRSDNFRKANIPKTPAITGIRRKGSVLLEQMGEHAQYIQDLTSSIA